MSTSSEAFWNALEVNKNLQERLKSICSRERIVSIAAEFGFIFSKDEIGDDALLNDGYRLVWPSEPGEIVKRVELADFSNIKQLYIELIKLRQEVKEINDRIMQVEKYRYR